MARWRHARSAAAPRRRIGALAASVLAAMMCLVAANPGAGYASDRSLADGSYLSLTASSLDAVGLSYAGTFAVPRPSGSVQVLRFTMTSGALTEWSVTQACSDGITTVTTAGSASLDSTTFDAVSLAVTVGGTPVTFTVDSPPTSPFPGQILLRDITLIGTTVSADTLSAATLSTHPAGC